MIDLLRKEGICSVKLKAIRMLISVSEDEMYTKSMQIKDLTNLIADLDQMENRMKQIEK